MINTLSDLNLGNPEMWSVGLFAVITLEIVDDEFDNETLL
jgi:hypothetical protein